MATKVNNLINPPPKLPPSIQRSEHFQKKQWEAINKAMSNQECPVKQKHIRTIVCGTHQEERAVTFWAYATQVGLQAHPIVCWKFCQVVHQTLRDGHPKSIVESYHHREMLRDLGKLWGLLKEGYGKLIQLYTTLIVNKVLFHARNPRFPGKLEVTDGMLDAIGESDVNVFFQLVCEMFDYLDDILALQAAVFSSLEMGRANSMTNSGQCRLAPLIVCIQDSSHLYDYCVKVLFKLHAVLPPGTLEGHRTRFNQQFKLLKQFYLNSSNLQYFKSLIKIPLLPENPPNFLRQSELQDHVRPDVELFEKYSDSPEKSEADGTLIDLDGQESLRSFKIEQQNLQTVIDEKDRMINALHARIEELQLLLQQLKFETAGQIDSLKQRHTELECNSMEQDRVISLLRMEKENQLKELDELRQELERHRQGTDMQTELAKSEAKFIKMKEAYGKIRTEHIELLRNKANLDKKLADESEKAAQHLRQKEELESKLIECKTLQDQSASNATLVDELTQKATQNETLNKKLLSEMAQLQQEKRQIESQFAACNQQIESLKRTISESEKTNVESLAKKEKETEWHFFELVVKEVQLLAKRDLENEATVHHTVNVNCTPEHFFMQCDNLSELLNGLIKSTPSLHTQHPHFDDLVSLVIRYNHELLNILTSARFIDQTLPNIELGQELMSRCKQLVLLSIELGNRMKGKGNSNETIDLVSNCLNEIINLKPRILPEMSVDVSKDIGALLEQELSDMTKAIQEGADRIQDMMAKAKEKSSGINLEVNEKVLNGCTNLMQKIIQLIKDARSLQEEIRAKGKGHANPKEFYQRNHRWTEGLISAAKVVGHAAKLLVDAADKMVSGNATYEELIVSSKEIAAATAQLVVASKVKAERDSERLSKLASSSKSVTEATAHVVATATSCAQMVEEKDNFDFSKLSDVQAKKLEMESKIREKQLETALTKEREKLARLRKLNYHLSEQQNDS